MKLLNRYNILLAACLLLGGVSVCNANNTDKTLSQVVVKSSDIYRYGTLLKVNALIDLTNVDLGSCNSIVLYPTVVDDNNNKAILPEVIVDGRRRHILFERAPKKDIYTELQRKNGAVQTVDYQGETSYSNWMDNGRLIMVMDKCGCGGKPVESAQVDLNSLKKTPFYTNWMPELGYIVPPTEVKYRAEKGKAFLDFPVNKTTINPNYRQNPSELESIRNTINKVKNDSNLTITHITIHGFASPEGSYANNERLASGRAQSLKQYVSRLYNFKDSIFTVNSTAEDIEGMNNFIATSNSEFKSDAQNIMADGKNADIQEKELKKIGNGNLFSFLVSECFPALRRSEYEVDYKVRPYSVSEGKTLLKTHPQQLSLQEMYQIAKSYPAGSDEYNETFDIAARLFPDDPIANLNASSVALSKRDLDGAKKFLAKANQSAPETINNQAVLQVFEGNIDTAKQLFEKSAQMGCDAASKNLEKYK